MVVIGQAENIVDSRVYYTNVIRFFIGGTAIAVRYTGETTTAFFPFSPPSNGEASKGYFENFLSSNLASIDRGKFDRGVIGLEKLIVF